MILRQSEQQPATCNTSRFHFWSWVLSGAHGVSLAKPPFTHSSNLPSFSTREVKHLASTRQKANSIIIRKMYNSHTNIFA